MWIDRSHPCALDFHGHRALQQAHGHDDSLAPLEIHQNSFESVKRAATDPDPPTNSDVRPWLARKSGTYQGTNGLYFTLVDGNRPFRYANDGNQTRSFQDR